MEIDDDLTTDIMHGDPVLFEQWDRRDSLGDLLIRARLNPGRDWEPERTEDGGLTINTTPVYDLRVYEPSDGEGGYYVLALAGPVVHFAVRTREDIGGFLERFAADVEEDNDGIDDMEGFAVPAHHGTARDLAEAVEEWGAEPVTVAAEEPIVATP